MFLIVSIFISFFSFSFFFFFFFFGGGRGGGGGGFNDTAFANFFPLASGNCLSGCEIFVNIAKTLSPKGTLHSYEFCIFFVCGIH